MISKDVADRLQKLLRMLVDDGHLTTMGKRQIELVIQAEGEK